MDNVLITVDELNDIINISVIEGIIPIGTYKSDAAAMEDGKESGEHYYLDTANIYGLPKNIIKKID